MKRFKKNFQKNPKQQKKVIPRDVEFDYENALFETYYKEQLKEYFQGNQEEWTQFWNICKERLPVTFRVSSNMSNSEIFAGQFRDCKNFVQELYNEQKQNKQEENDDEQVQKLIQEMEIIPIKWYKNVFELKCDSQQLQKKIKKFHQLLEYGNQSGLLTRQELVSMLPPLLLDPSPSDLILDMCAAPGSKTVQILELMHEKARTQKIEFTGGLVSNELITQRSTILSHQINRCSSHGSIVVNHQAQFFPTIFQESKENQKQLEETKFDKILADVPCTGDGAVRKIPQKWMEWTSINAMKLHPIQLSICARSIQLAKVGGLVLYSTCSICPIEDEAVVGEIFRSAEPDSLELVDCHELLPQFKGRPGMYDWKVLMSKLTREESGLSIEQLEKLSFEEMFDHVKNYSDLTEEQLKDVKTNNYRHLKESMWPLPKDKMKEIGIEKTMRVLPHDQNSGGFYVALFRKKKEKVFNFIESEHQISKRQQKKQKQKEWFEQQQKLNKEKELKGEEIEVIKDQDYIRQSRKYEFDILESLNIEEEMRNKVEGNINFIKTFDNNIGGEIVLRNQRQKELRQIQKEMKKYQAKQEEKLKETENEKEKQEEQEVVEQVQEEEHKEEQKEGNMENEQGNEEQEKEQEQEGKQVDQEGKVDEKSERRKKKDKHIIRAKIFELYKTVEEEDFEQFSEHYGLVGVDRDQFITAIQGTKGKIRYISTSLRDFVKFQENQKQFNMIQAGTRIFQKKGGYFRLCQDGVKILFNHITKRKLKISMENMISLLHKAEIPFEDIKNEEFRQLIKDQGLGGLVVYTEPCEKYPDMEIVSIMVFNNSIQVFVSKEDKPGYKLIYNY